MMDQKKINPPITGTGTRCAAQKEYYKQYQEILQLSYRLNLS
jgi:hypothetical protein